MRTAPAFRRPVPVAWLLAVPLLFLLLSGCSEGETAGPGPDGGGGGLPLGHYLVDEEFDGELGSEEYFVVLPGSAWESVSYWISYGGKVCGIERLRGTYTLGDSGLALIEEERAEVPDDCPATPSTQADFDAATWEAIPVGESTVLGLRNVTANAFDARGAFAGPSWRTFHRQGDPHGFYD